MNAQNDVAGAGPAFVDRERELAELTECLASALSGKGQICFVTGLAGSGKTALVRHFVEQVFATNSEVVVAMGTCNSQTGVGDPFLPFREALTMLTDETAVQQAAGRVSPENTNRLRRVLAASVNILVEVAPELVGLFLPAGALVGAVGKALAEKAGWTDRLEKLVKTESGLGITAPAVEQARVFEQYTAFMKRVSEKVPLILFLDDLQWADSASLNLLFHLARRVEDSRVLIVGAYRPEDVALGRAGERHPLEAVVNELRRYRGDMALDLDAIPEEMHRRFVDSLLDIEPNRLSQAFREALFFQTGGHALFTVELIQAMKDRGDLVWDTDGRWVTSPSLDWSTLPARVEGVIEERIDRLNRELQSMLQVATIQGEQFAAEVVARVEDMSDRDAIWQLSRELQRRHRLVHAEGFVQLGRVRLSSYRFAHNLFQRYLYESLAEAERVYLHRGVGQALEELLAGQTEEAAGELSRHFEVGGLAAKAATYRLLAGERARRLSAYDEAVGHLNRGLELASTLEPGIERTRLELDLQVSLGKVLLAMYGYASPQVDHVFARARELVRALGDPPQAIQVVLAQSAFSLMRGQLARAREEAEDVLRMAQRAGDERIELTSHLILGAADLYTADYAGARQHLDRVLALYDPVQHRDLAYQQGQDPGVQALAFLSRVYWLQGYPQRALDKCDEAMRLAIELDHPYSRTIATLHASTLRAWLRWWPESQAFAQDALELAKEAGFEMRQANATVLRGLTLAHQGEIEEGISELLEGLYLWAATGAGLVVYGRASLAEAYWLAERRDEGLEAAAEALYPVEETWWLPEEHRVRAELLLLEPGAEVEAERDLRQAVDLAHSQGAKFLELRALTSLARLLHRRGDSEQVRARLAEIYNWFPGDLELPDLQDARNTLQALSAIAVPAPTG